MAVIEQATRRGLFRECDVRKKGVWHEALADAQVMGLVAPHGQGVWSHRRYTPTRYEHVQIRLPKCVFWGLSALWLLGAEADGPRAL